MDSAASGGFSPGLDSAASGGFSPGLVLDTRGISVWCAAGKGTFGTEELVRRVRAVRLDLVVSHRRLVLPQLAATGVAAHEVQRECGFRVVWGPVRAADLPRFLASGMKAEPEMRRVRFGLRDRAAVVPVELVQGGRQALLIAAVFALLGGLGVGVFRLERVLSAGVPSALMVLGAFLGGAVVAPLPSNAVCSRAAMRRRSCARGTSSRSLCAHCRGSARQSGGDRSTTS